MGKWNQASKDGRCYNCDEEEGYDNLVSYNGWPVCERCAFEMERDGECDE